MKKVGTWLIILAIVAGAVGAGLWLRNRQAQSQAAAGNILRTGEVTRGDLTITVPASGNITANQNANLSFTIPGKVAVVNVAAGDTVEAGQELAQLDTRDLERTIRQAKIAVEQAQLNRTMLDNQAGEEDVKLAELAVRNAQQSLVVARASKAAAEAQANMSIRLAQEAKDRTEEAYQNYLDFLDQYGLPSAYASGITVAYLEAEGNVGITMAKAEYQIQQAQSQWTSAYQALQQAKQNLETLQEDPDNNRVRQTELQIEQAQLNLAQAQETLADAVLIAPFDGVVTAVNIQEGISAPTGQVAITMLDNSNFYVDVTVDEIDIGKVATGQVVSITLDAYPQTVLSGNVERIAAIPSNVGGIIAYLLHVQITETEGVGILKGMTANVLIRTDTITDVLIVPNWALRTDQSTGESYVYRAENDVPVRTPIVAGQRNDTHTIILSGLDEGMTVALVAEETNLFDFQGPPPMMRR